MNLVRKLLLSILIEHYLDRSISSDAEFNRSFVKRNHRDLKYAKINTKRCTKLLTKLVINLFTKAAKKLGTKLGAYLPSLYEVMMVKLLVASR